MEFAYDSTRVSHRVLGHVLVVGLGTSGKAVAHYCADLLAADSPRISSLTLYAGAFTEEAQAFIDAYIDDACRVVFDEETIVGTYDLAIVSPGISSQSRFYQAAQTAALEVIGEPEFAFRESPERWIAITGTNGKTTTTALTAHLLSEAGFSARAVGNIGTPCIEAVALRGIDEYLVAELSSYQLASMYTFSPIAAALLNITPDHLHWHGSHEAYAAAKARIFAQVSQEAWAVLDCSSTETRAIASDLIEKNSRVCLLGGDSGIEERAEIIAAGHCSRGAAWHDSSSDLLRVCLDDRGYDLVKASELQIKGDHNIANALAAAVLALSCDVDVQEVRRGLRSFRPLEHRNEPCGAFNGISFFNDSKATNTDATLKALDSFGESPLIMLYGGTDKGTELDTLVDKTLKRCKAVVCYGDARARFIEAFEDAQSRSYGRAAGCTVLVADHLADALQVAIDRAQIGDAICLSPACASFDEFTSFEQRGVIFKELIADLKKA
jgi:UDP-N-acetylmuramoylalanine--D-glutamate ligase